MASTLNKGLFRATVLGALFTLALLAGACGKKTPEDKLAEAQQLLQQRQTPLAILKLRDLIREHPDEDAAIEARFGLASIYLQLGREENVASAVDLYRELYNLLGIEDNRGFSALTQIVQIRLAEDNFDEVFVLMDEIIAATAGDPVIQQSMMAQKAMIRLLTEDEEQVAQGVAYLEEIMLESEEDSIRGHAREVLSKHFRDSGDFAASSAVYQKYLDRYPEDTIRPMLILTMGINSRLAGDEEEAARLVDEGATLMEAQVDEELNLNRRAEMLQGLAALLSTARDFDRAEAAFRRIMADQPATRAALDAQFAIAQMYVQSENLDRAEEVFSAIARENANTQIAEIAQRWLDQIAQYREFLAQEAAAPADDQAPVTETE